MGLFAEVLLLGAASSLKSRLLPNVKNPAFLQPCFWMASKKSVRGAADEKVPLPNVQNVVFWQGTFPANHKKVPKRFWRSGIKNSIT